MAKRFLTAADIIPSAGDTKSRKTARPKRSTKDQHRRMAVGPDISFYFECYETILPLVPTENRDAEPVPSELEAPNKPIPNGSELMATLLVEIDEPRRRKRVLDSIGGIERTTFLRVGGEPIIGVAAADADPTSTEAKASIVRFAFTAEQIAAFSSPHAEVVLGFNHPNYRHMATMTEAMRAELTTDFQSSAAFRG